MGSVSVGIQCPLTSSLVGEFLGYCSGMLGYRQCWCLSPFSSPSISQCFSIHSSPAIGFHSCFFFTTDVSAPIQSTLADSEFPGFELALVPDVVVPEAEHGVRIKHKPRFKCLPWPGFKPRTSQSNGRERYR